MQKFDVNSFADFDGVTVPVEDDSIDKPDWDKLIVGPCVRTPGWDDGDDSDEG